MLFKGVLARFESKMPVQSVMQVWRDSMIDRQKDGYICYNIRDI